MNRELDINTCDGIRTYATRKNLVASIERFQELSNFRYIIVNTETGRWTAIFLVSEYANIHGGYIGGPAQRGFMSV